MKIKIFEEYNRRYPTKIDDRKWFEVIESLGEELFNQTESDFFQKLLKENLSEIYDWDINKTFITINSYGRIADSEYFEIRKLKDDWFLIYHVLEHDDETSISSRYKCDEFDEVKLYLKENTCFTF